jgi:hypothetical protein
MGDLGSGEDGISPIPCGSEDGISPIPCGSGMHPIPPFLYQPDIIKVPSRRSKEAVITGLRKILGLWG